MKRSLLLFPGTIRNQWKEATRSSYWQKNLLINILLGFFLLYFLINMILLGVFLGRILLSAFPDSDPVWSLSGLLLYYFLADLLIRFLMQPAPVIPIIPYLHLPVTRNSLFHYLLIRSGFSFFNFFPLVVLVPFTIMQMMPLYSVSEGLVWLLTLFLLALANNYLVFVLKKIFTVRPVILILLAVAVGGLIWLDLSVDRILSLGFGKGLMEVVQQPVWMVIPFGFLILTYWLSWYYLYRQRYMEQGQRQTKNYQVTESSRYISERFGVIGNLVSLEMKMILRNNRPRNYLVLSILFLFYGFMIYPRHATLPFDGMLFFMGLLFTGMMTLQYGQLVLSWESSNFDRLSTANFSTRDFFLAKFWLFFLFNTFCFVVTLPYAFYGYNILLLNLVAWLFNSGINIFVILFLGSYNTKRVDLSKSAMFNYQGVNMMHFILILPVIGLPVFIFWMVSVFTNAETGLIVTGLIGLAGLVFYKQLTNIVTRQFLSRKQTILQGFRNG